MIEKNISFDNQIIYRILIGFAEYIQEHSIELNKDNCFSEIERYVTLFERK